MLAENQTLQSDLDILNDTSSTQIAGLVQLRDDLSESFNLFKSDSGAQVAGLEGQVSDLTSQVSDLEAQRAELVGQVDSLNAEKEQIAADSESQIADLQSGIAKLTGERDELGTASASVSYTHLTLPTIPLV